MTKARRRTHLQKQQLIRECIERKARNMRECGIEHPTFTMSEIASVTGYSRTNPRFRDAVWSQVDTGYLTAFPVPIKSGITDVRWHFMRTVDAPLQLEMVV